MKLKLFFKTLGVGLLAQILFFGLCIIALILLFSVTPFLDTLLTLQEQTQYNAQIVANTSIDQITSQTYYDTSDIFSQLLGYIVPFSIVLFVFFVLVFYGWARLQSFILSTELQTKKILISLGIFAVLFVLICTLFTTLDYFLINLWYASFVYGFLASVLACIFILIRVWTVLHQSLRDICQGAVFWTSLVLLIGLGLMSAIYPVIFIGVLLFTEMYVAMLITNNNPRKKSRKNEIYP